MIKETGKKRRVMVLTLAAITMLVSACGFTPIYGPHDLENESVVTSMNNIAINNIPNRYGQILRNHLIDRLYTKGRPTNPSLRLSVTIKAKETDLAIQKDSTASRRELSLWSSYSLKNLKGQKLVSGSAHSVVSYSKLDAQYGTVTGQRDAYGRALKETSEQIVNRLALYFAEGQYRTPVPKYNSFLLPSDVVKTE